MTLLPPLLSSVDLVVVVMTLYVSFVVTVAERRCASVSGPSFAALRHPL